MTRTGWQKTWVRMATTLLTAAVMIMIFFFSTENGNESDRRSGVISMAVIRLIHPEYEQMDEEAMKDIYDGVQHIVRKCAHFTEYMMLGFMIRLCVESWFGNRKRGRGCLGVAASGAGILYACTDEAHQMAIEGRMGAWADVLVDAGGVLAGAVIGTLLIRSLEKRKKSLKLQGEKDGLFQKQ